MKQTSTDVDHLKGNCKGWLIAQIILADMKVSLVKGQEISKGNYGVFSSSKNEALKFVSNWVEVILHKRFDNNIK